VGGGDFACKRINPILVASHRKFFRAGIILPDIGIEGLISLMSCFGRFGHEQTVRKSRYKKHGVTGFPASVIRRAQQDANKSISMHVDASHKLAVFRPQSFNFEPM